MNLRKYWLLFCSCTFFFFSSDAQEKYSEVKIPVSSTAVKNFIYNNLNLDHYEYEGNAIVAVLNTAEMNRLRQSGNAFQVLIDDVVSHTIQMNKDATPENSVAPFQGTSCQKIATLIPTPASFGTGGSLRLGASVGNPGYFTYAEMLSEMNALAAAYPSLVTVYSIGNSANGLAIKGVKLTHSASAENKPEILYTALQHAREAIGGTSLIFLMEYLAENYTTDNRVKELLDNRQLFIIPCLNPDGYSFNYGGSSSSYPVSGGGLWRKNRRNTGGGSTHIGVDLNRNYSVDWGNCAGASSSCGTNDKTDETYYGPSAFSEPETQALRDFVYSRKFINAIDQHCYGPYYSLPYGRPSLHTPLSRLDSAYYNYVPALMGLYNGHRAGNSPQTVNYEVAGGIKDWLLMGDIGTGTKGKVYGMTGEAGGGGFWAPVSQIMQLCKENCFQNIQLAYAAGDYYNIEDKSDIAITRDSGYFSFKVKRIGLGANPVTVSIVPIHNVQYVGAAITKTLANYYDFFEDSIQYTVPPTFVCGQTIQFAWKVESGGITTYDTVTKFFNPSTLISDDMEGSFGTNWIANPTGSNGWGYSNGASMSGTQSLTESPNGNYTTSSTRTVTYKSSINLIDATSTYLSFWVKHRAENFRDKLQIQASHDSSTWVAICGSNTVQENNTTNGGTLGGLPALTGIRENWTRELFDLSDYNGDPTVYFRFRFTSDADASAFAFEKDDGFNIDDLKLIKTTNISTLAVKFGNLNAQLLMNNVVRLDWEAYVDQQHDHFEIQRMDNKNNSFTTIESMATPPPYNTFDRTPQEGINYYRIKELDKGGVVSYSNVIKIMVKNNIITTIYPNPVSKVLSVKIRNNITKDNYTIKFCDATGRTVYDQIKMVEAGNNEIKVNVGVLPVGVYFIKIMNGSNETVITEKFVKQ